MEPRGPQGPGPTAQGFGQGSEMIRSQFGEITLCRVQDEEVVGQAGVRQRGIYRGET